MSGSISEGLALARARVAEGDLAGAATVYDRLHGGDPEDETVARERANLLDRLAIVEHAITFRYVPAGPFLMGEQRGQADERPVHPVELDAFWLSEVPVSWAAYCRLMEWEAPPRGRPQGSGLGFQVGTQLFPTSHLLEDNKIRIQYCEDASAMAAQWIWHIPHIARDLRQKFGSAPAEFDERPISYEQKPMVSVPWQDAEDLCRHLSSGPTLFRLPTEAEWEKAARGGLVGRLYPWGDEAPTLERCDFSALERGSLRPVRDYRPNGYGLYGMSGSVWEWTSDWYDAEYYRESPGRNPTGPAEGREKVLRGGSWTDCAEVLRVSFRMSRGSVGWREQSFGPHASPTIGFRLCRIALTSATVAGD